MTGIRVRFAPSPTGPLHIGGVRTALYNYLFAKRHGGTFILRIEDTDQTRYVPGAEEYIQQSLQWLGLEPDEGFGAGGPFGPYKQSERKDIYTAYAAKLVASGHAYYAFDTPEELEKWRQEMEAKGIHSPKYDQTTRKEFRNSLTLPENEVNQLMEEGKPYVIRLKVPEGEIVVFEDIIRGKVQFETAELDDKVMLKADGLPTYHLANIIDDHMMEISHVIRGEEWLSSTAHHVLLYRAFGWEDTIPQFAHLPLILKPSGKGKLSKRDGAQFGFPVFPLEWFAEEENESYLGFREFGFLPEAALNFLALLGWSPGDDQEIMPLEALSKLFSLEKIVKSGARFDIEKAKWFNQQYIHSKSASDLLPYFLKIIPESEGLTEEHAMAIIELLKPRITLLPDFLKESRFIFEKPSGYEQKMLEKKWTPVNKEAMHKVFVQIEAASNIDDPEFESNIKSYIEEQKFGLGNILPLLRVCMSGSSQGPDVFKMMAILGKEELIQRLNAAFRAFDDIIKL